MRATTSPSADTVGFDELRAVVGAGEGVVGRFPGIVCVVRCPDPEPVRAFLALCAEVAGPAPGWALAHRLVTWISGPDAPGPELRFGTVAAAGDRLAVFLVGAVDARVEAVGGLLLSGAHAAIGTDRLLPRPAAPLVLSLDGEQVRADPADVHDLRAGVVPGSGVVLHPTDFDPAPSAVSVAETVVDSAPGTGHEWFDTGEDWPEPFPATPFEVPTQRLGGRNGSAMTADPAGPQAAAWPLGDAADDAADGADLDADRPAGDPDPDHRNGSSVGRHALFPVSPAADLPDVLSPAWPDDVAVEPAAGAALGDALVVDDAPAPGGNGGRGASRLDPPVSEDAPAAGDTERGDAGLRAWAFNAPELDDEAADDEAADDEADGSLDQAVVDADAVDKHANDDAVMADGPLAEADDAEADDAEADGDAVMDDAVMDDAVDDDPRVDDPTADDSTVGDPPREGSPGVAPADAATGADQATADPVGGHPAGDAEIARPAGDPPDRAAVAPDADADSILFGPFEAMPAGAATTTQGAARTLPAWPRPGPGAPTAQPTEAPAGPTRFTAAGAGPAAVPAPPVPAPPPPASPPLDPAAVRPVTPLPRRPGRDRAGPPPARADDAPSGAGEAPIGLFATPLAVDRSAAAPEGIGAGGGRPPVPRPRAAGDLTAAMPGVRFPPPAGSAATPPVGPRTDPPPIASVAPPPPVLAPAARPSPGRLLPREARIRGYRCENGHLNDPRSPSCRHCGAPIDERVGGLVAGARPPLGRLVFDDGAAHVVDGGYLVGRMPEADERVRAGELRPIVVEDHAGSVSRVHAEVRVSGWDVIVVDTGSRNGTYVAGADEGVWTALPPRRSRRLLPGTRVRLGARTFVFESSSSVR